jgi:N-acetylneuraminate synthase
MNLFLIAEIGINHNGSMDIAKKLIDGAALAGFDAVKFQKRTIDIVYEKKYLDGPRESPWGKTQREQKTGLEFSFEQYTEIDNYCKSKSIQWSASSWDLKSQDFLNGFDLKFNKIASPMLGHKPLLNRVADDGIKTFISTGMATLKEIDFAVNIFTQKKM